MAEAPTTAADWLALVCPALWNQGEPVYGKWLYMALAGMAPEETWGGRYAEAMACRAAYHWAVATPAATASATGTAEVAPTGQLTSEKARDVSRTYAVRAPSSNRSAADQLYERNEFGIMFLDIRDGRESFGTRVIRA